MSRQLSASISISILAIAAAVTYYFAYFLPNQAAAETLSHNQANCSQLQDKGLAIYRQQSELPDHARDIISAQNHFNTKMRKCVVEVSDTGSLMGVAVNGNPYNYTSNTTALINPVENVYLGICTVDTDFNSKTSSSTQTTVACLDAANNNITPDQFDVLDKNAMTQ